MARVVLLLGDDDDPHLAAVAPKLLDRGVEPLWIGIGSNFQLVSASIDGLGVSRLWLDGRPVPIRDVVAIWDRARSSMPIVRDESWQYVFRERKAFFEALPALLPGARWMNSPASAVPASSKVTQLLVAREFGLSIPPTLVTNEAEQVREMQDSAPANLIFKALTWLATTNGRVLFTNRLARPLGDAFGAALRPAPVIFQEQIGKRYELRVTCVGERLFAARIESQAKPETELDWRREQQQLTYQRYNLPDTVAAALRAVMQRLGIVFGAFDLARDPDGRYVFFEVNPAGNWLWLEEELGLPISDAIADWLSGAGDAAGADISNRSPHPAAVTTA